MVSFKQVWAIQPTGKMLICREIALVICVIICLCSSYSQNKLDPTNFRQPQSIDTKCTITSQGLAINVTCTCKESIGVTGYQVIFQQQNFHRFFKLFVHTGSCSSALVHNTEESGTYRVSVFPVRQHEGIMNSFVSFFQEVVVSNFNPPTTATAASDDNFPVISTIEIIIIIAIS